jgi:hypothetical protein
MRVKEGKRVKESENRARESERVCEREVEVEEVEEDEEGEDQEALEAWGWATVSHGSKKEWERGVGGTQKGTRGWKNQGGGGGKQRWKNWEMG